MELPVKPATVETEAEFYAFFIGRVLSVCMEQVVASRSLVFQVQLCRSNCVSVCNGNAQRVSHPDMIFTCPSSSAAFTFTPKCSHVGPWIENMPAVYLLAVYKRRLINSRMNYKYTD
jgi:hypothetical protein